MNLLDIPACPFYYSPFNCGLSSTLAATRWTCVMPQQPKDELLTAAETCRYLKITPRTLYRYLKGHRIPAFKLGKEWRFVRSDLEEWIKERTAAGRHESR